MKKLLLVLLCFISLSVRAQWPLYDTLTLDPHDTLYHSLVIIDTVHYHHSIWQVGSPHKPVFTSALSLPHAIVTDTSLPYTASDTSVFIVKIPGIRPPSISMGFPFADFGFYYQLDMDTTARAIVEMSIDTGVHWLNVLDTLPPGYHWPMGPPPNLHSNTTGWTQFLLGHGWATATPDTIQFRFTFISGSVFANKDGWIIDNIMTSYYWEGVIQTQNDNFISVYPNPSKGNLYFHSSRPFTGRATISVWDMGGREVYSLDKIPSDGLLSLPLPGGTYVLKYEDASGRYAKKIIIN